MQPAFFKTQMMVKSLEEIHQANQLMLAWLMAGVVISIILFFALNLRGRLPEELEL